MDSLHTLTGATSLPEWRAMGGIDTCVSNEIGIGNLALEALASHFAKLELRLRGSQSGAWEPADYIKFPLN